MAGRALRLLLELPPSVNAAFANVPGKGRVRTAVYRQWQKLALAAIWGQARDITFPGTFRVAVLASDQKLKRRRDADNLGKAICDVLTKAGTIADDYHHHLRSIVLTWTPKLPAGTCRVHVIELPAAPALKQSKAPRRAQFSSAATRALAKPAAVPASIMRALRVKGINVADPSRIHVQ